MATLTPNDRQVLSALFDAESKPSPSITPTISLPTSSLPGISDSLLAELQTIEYRAILPLNTTSPSRESIKQAISSLRGLINEHSNYASAYNNRAQAIRMLVGDDLTDPAASSTSIYADLCSAIHLASPAEGRPVSPLQAKILASAYTHRGHLLYKASKSLSGSSQDDITVDARLPDELQGKTAEQLERLASKDFADGGKYGNEIARKMAVQLNPYARLCGEIVRESMRRDLEEVYKGKGVDT
jgi:hypothetical protein